MDQIVVTVVKQRLTDGSYVYDVRLTQGPHCVVTFAAVTERDASTLADHLVLLINKHSVELAGRAFDRVAA